MGRFLLSVLLAGLLASDAWGDYASTHLYELIGQADLIAAGSIKEVDDQTFLLEVEDLVVGEARNNGVRIKRFRDWPCAWRWSEYSAGRRVLVFAKREGRELRLIGAGGEGESPIVDGLVYCQFVCPVGPSATFAERKVATIRYRDLRSAIIEYRKLFRLVPAKQAVRTIGAERGYFPFEAVNFLGDATAMMSFSDQSPLHQMLFDQTLREKRRLRSKRPSAPID